MSDRVRKRTRLLDSWRTRITGFSVSEYSGTLTEVERCIDAKPSKLAPILVERRLEREGKLPPKGIARLRRWERTYDFGNAFRKDVAGLIGGRRVYARKKVGSRTYIMDGTYFPTAPTTLMPGYFQDTPIETLFALGGRAIRSCMPTNPHANLAVTFGELLHDGLPSIPLLRSWRKTASQGLVHSAAQEYLNVEFGWKPLIADIRAGLQAYERADTIWKQFVRNSGKSVRRSFAFDPTETTVVTNLGLSPGWPTGTSYIQGTSGVYSKSVTTTTSYRFSGCFRYFVPDATSGLGIRREMSRLRLLYGASVDPETLWNLAPWSWLSDWVVDFGGLVTALTRLSQDGLILQYGYLSEWKTEKTVYSLRGHTFADGSSGDSDITAYRVSKRRVKASPFGFGLTADGFTPRQWAILAAIGLSGR